ncbi:hypothetical protein BDP55DRAFT_637645 [Colletotrichum godetiae]|uniref:Uncharacterized protein n=1 Tax=Colletotrichum godetiae TaxID=1209918 RepID=A0AAJ0ABS1_9PEZI|nr:uncharacterized protein BDP55DRAFT_637645 [Colletotrichum godetiae]KAK1658687.1 hypothetical protein BDP55DRAFT_637645 [Colletotrichum godetiae]
MGFVASDHDVVGSHGLAILCPEGQTDPEGARCYATHWMGCYLKECGEHGRDKLEADYTPTRKWRLEDHQATESLAILVREERLGRSTIVRRHNSGEATHWGWVVRKTHELAANGDQFIEQLVIEDDAGGSPGRGGTRHLVCSQSVYDAVTFKLLSRQDCLWLTVHHGRGDAIVNEMK